MEAAIAERYPALWCLLAGYFHQDWDVEGSDWPDVLTVFRRDSTPAAAAGAADEIDRLLREYPGEEVLEQVLYGQFGCAYNPRPDLGGPSPRRWLQCLATALRSPVSRGEHGAAGDVRPGIAPESTTSGRTRLS
ncbi:MAG: hypothetical protein AVDCRST_MAG68-3550 [uncultured Gemmatimonadetes bacterium]|uniref:CdiI immunity protein domain-containing protein n=1 Tax=uncultured Gemmatimonadota bacterium TaxID=203437 RepID=A0A6J4M8D9_9BACT|nr:MAG: hypothetical protein AVDCRST_MAG68-3550 [uncultured Gemmatimonadota bacterium]